VLKVQSVEVMPKPLKVYHSDTTGIDMKRNGFPSQQAFAVVCWVLLSRHPTYNYHQVIDFSVLTVEDSFRENN
jgi:hypothetical protein